MNELDPTTLRYGDWIYWLFDHHIYQGRFYGVDGDGIWLSMGLCRTGVSYPPETLKLFKEYPSDINFGLSEVDIQKVRIA